MARGAAAMRSPFSDVADSLMHTLVSTTAMSSQQAFDLLEVARAWPHFVDGKRLASPASRGWIVEVRSRHPLSKTDLRKWHAEAERKSAARERETARLRRAEAEATAKRERDEKARIRRAMAAVAAAQTAAPPGPRAAYVYQDGDDRTDRVPIVARAGVLFVRRRDKGAGYTFVHEPTGLGLSAPGREELKTQKRAIEQLDRAARPAVIAALTAALARGGGQAAIDQFYAAWVADDAQATRTPPARRRERGASPFAEASSALGKCSDCHGSGTTQDGQATAYCTCPVGQQLHDRELARAWAPAETERIVQFLDERAARENEVSVQRALKAAARALRQNGHVRDKAATYLLRASSKGRASARAALRAAADELARGTHLPPVPRPATAIEIIETYESRDGTTAMQAIDALEAALARGDRIDFHGPLRVGFLGLLNDALTRGDAEVWQTDEALCALRHAIATMPSGLSGPSTTANAKPLARLRARERALLDKLRAGRARHATALLQRAPRVFALGSEPPRWPSAATTKRTRRFVGSGASPWRTAAEAVAEHAAARGSSRG